MNNLEKFLNVYKENLIKAQKETPDLYAWSENEFSIVYQRMSTAIIKGTFNKDSIAIIKTCKDLKIKHTYKDIKKFIENN